MRHKAQQVRETSHLSAIRGAVQIATDTPEQIAQGTVAMLNQITSQNNLQNTDLISLFFTITPDLTSELPPLALQEAGWEHVPMLCAAELQSQMMIPRVIRVLAHVHWRNQHTKPRSAYLSGTTPTRPDQTLLDTTGYACSSAPPSTLNRRYP